MITQFNGFEINPIHNGDAWKVCDLCVANEERFKRYFHITLEKNLTPTLSQYFVEDKVKSFQNKSEFLFTLKHSKTRDLAGLIYIKELDWKKNQGEFAYCIGYNFESNGLISKSIKELSKHAFEELGLENLQIIVHKSNVSSVKVAERNNFIWKKTLPKAYAPPNEDDLDMELYELYKKDIGN